MERNIGKLADVEYKIGHVRTLAQITRDGLMSAGTVEEIEAWRDICASSFETMVDTLDRALRELKVVGECLNRDGRD